MNTKKKIALLFALACFCLALVFKSFLEISPNVAAKQASSTPFNNGAWQALYTDPIIQKATSPEAKQAMEKLPPDLQAMVKEKVAEIIAQTLKEGVKAPPAVSLSLPQILGGEPLRQGINASAAFNDQSGNKVTSSLTIAEATLNLEADWKTLPNFTAPPRPPTDRDRDGMLDIIERDLANAFAPYYYVSGGESNNFATFYTRLPLNVAQTYGQTPLVHHRVKPLGFVTDPVTRQKYFGAKIEYYTLWDRDNGIVGNPSLCGLAVSIFEQIRFAHDFDVERSAVLVYAQTTEPNVINLNVNDYGARLYFTAAHEGVPVLDHSYLYYVYGRQPIPPGSHINLALTRSKHATYAFNPDGMPLLPPSAIIAVLNAIWYQCINGFGNGFGFRDLICLAALQQAYSAFTGCVTEKWTDIGGQFASQMINVGEPRVPGYPDIPENCCLFIEDDSERALRLKSKFVVPITYNYLVCTPGFPCGPICFPDAACF